MLSEIGKVKAILDGAYLLIESKEAFSNGEILKVFGRVDVSSVTPDLPQVDVPKGEIKIVLKQSDGLFLASRFQRTTRRQRSISDPFTDQIRQILGPKEVIEEVPAGWSAELDTSKGLPFKIDPAVKPGDLVSRG
jgi:hypothetical protein